MKYSNDILGDITRDLPACSAVSQPAAPPRAPKMLLDNSTFKGRIYYGGAQRVLEGL
jgi:hypothetical protein